MYVKLSVAGQAYTFASPERCRAAIEGLRGNAARYAEKARVATVTADALEAALAKGLEEDRAKRAARKAAKAEE